MVPVPEIAPPKVVVAAVAFVLLIFRMVAAVDPAAKVTAPVLKVSAPEVL